MKIKNICQPKVTTIDKEACAIDAAKIMKAAGVGCLVVAEKQGQIPVAVITDRDIIVKVVAAGKTADKTPVKEFMSKNLYVIKENQDIDVALSIMHENAIRRIPVINNENRLCGILSLDDLCANIADEQGAISAIIDKQSPKQTVKRSIYQHPKVAAYSE